MKKILLSISVLAFVGAVVAGATGAFFSDTETSTGNTFTAGAIDLKIDNTSFYLQNPNGTMIPSPGTTWTLKDLVAGTDFFFNFTDLKPGDIGEDTISLHVTNNPAWACVDVNITKNDDMDCTEPELTDDPTCQPTPNDTNLFDGELASELNFIFWNDDGDNVFEQEEKEIMRGPASNVLGSGVAWTLADAQTNNLGGDDGDPIDGSKTYYIGKAWCYGDIDDSPLAQNGPFDPNNPNGPDVRGPGVSCTGGNVISNASQSDSLMADISFYAVQSRNNAGFLCSNPRGSSISSSSSSNGSSSSSSSESSSSSSSESSSSSSSSSSEQSSSSSS